MSKTESHEIAIPNIIFIIPYRNRPQHKYFFLNYMTQTILSPTNKINNANNSTDKIEFYFSHQYDQRIFNRGAMKNIGFLAVKKKYPNHYKNMTFVFNDVDTIPFANIFNYATVPGTVKHFYGFTYALGGIVSVCGSDFERINGFPNYWGWGMEDKVLQNRCLKHSIQIDRGQFYPIGSPEILQLFDGVERLINPLDMDRSATDVSLLNGLAAITMLQYKITDGDDSFNNADNIHTVISDSISIFIINTTFFLTGTSFEREKKQLMHYDLRAGANQMTKHYTVNSSNFVDTTNTWKNIPVYPNTLQHQQLLQKYGKERTQQIIANMYYSTNNRGKPNHVK